MDSSERWYSVKEVAARYGVSPDTIRRRVKDGVIRAIRFSYRSSRRDREYNALRISASEMDRFERGNGTA